VDSYGFVASGQKGFTYVTCKKADDLFAQWATVMVTYYSDYLIQRSGTTWFTSGDWWEPHQHKVEYEWVVQKAEEVRLSDPSKGEPLFG